MRRPPFRKGASPPHQCPLGACCPCHFMLTFDCTIQCCIITTQAPRLLAELRNIMGDRRIAPGEAQNRTPFSQRMLDYRTTFLPMSVPFHHPMLAAAVEQVVADCAAHGVTMSSAALQCSLYVWDNSVTPPTPLRCFVESILNALAACTNTPWHRVLASRKQALHLPLYADLRNIDDSPHS